MRSNLFRPSALDKLAAPEQLDKLVTYADPKGWLALGVLGVLLALAMAWAVLGRIPARVDGTAVLVAQGGRMEVLAPLTGQLADWAVLRSGDTLQAGQKLGQISPEALRRELRATEAALAAAHGADVVALKKRLSQLRATALSDGQIVSPIAGRVLDIRAAASDWVHEGQALLLLERADAKLVADVYLPANSPIQRIEPGMQVQLTPRVQDDSAIGFLKAQVATVARYPISREGMRIRLRDKALVAQLASGGSALLVQAELQQDANGSYQRSVKSDGLRALNSGTLCAASIIVREDAPITLVLPWLKRLWVR